MPNTTTTPDPNKSQSSTITPTSVPGNPRATSLPDAAQVAKMQKANTAKLVEGLLKRIKEPDATTEGAELAPLAIHTVQGFRLTHAELQAIVDANPDHPIAKTYAEALKRTPSDEHPLVVERIDIEAIIDGKDVRVTTTHEPTRDGKMARVHRKELIDLVPASS
jgi:hypothetical protein